MQDEQPHDNLDDKLFGGKADLNTINYDNDNTFIECL